MQMACPSCIFRTGLAGTTMGRIQDTRVLARNRIDDGFGLDTADLPVSAVATPGIKRSTIWPCGNLRRIDRGLCDRPRLNSLTGQ